MGSGSATPTCAGVNKVRIDGRSRERARPAVLPPGGDCSSLTRSRLGGDPSPAGSFHLASNHPSILSSSLPAEGIYWRGIPRGINGLRPLISFRLSLLICCCCSSVFFFWTSWDGAAAEPPSGPAGGIKNQPRQGGNPTTRPWRLTLDQFRPPGTAPAVSCSLQVGLRAPPGAAR